MTAVRSRQIARERLRIRLAFSSIADPEPLSEGQLALVNAMAAIGAARQARLPAAVRRQIERAYGPRVARDFARATLAYSKADPRPHAKMASELAALEFGIRVLELEEGGAKRIDALEQASGELKLFKRDGDVLDAGVLRGRFREFKRLVAARGFVPYFSIDAETGELAPTRFVQTHLEAELRGRPSRKGEGFTPHT